MENRRVAAQIQNPARSNRAGCAPDFLLVQEVAGFLPMAKIGQHLSIVLPEGHQPRHLAVEAAGDLGQFPSFFPDRYVISLVNSLGAFTGQEALWEDVLQDSIPRLTICTRKVSPNLSTVRPADRRNSKYHHPAGIVKPGLPAGPGARVRRRRKNSRSMASLGSCGGPVPGF